MERILLSYGGRAADDAAVGRLVDRPRVEVVTLTTDYGQAADLEPVREQALAAGAARAHVLDVRERFATDYLLPALQAGALQDEPELAFALTGPLVAQALADVAAMEAATSVALASEPGGGDADAVAASLAAAAPHLRREVVLVSSTREGDTATRANLWVRQTAAPAGSPWDEVVPGAFVLTESPSSPADAAMLDVEFTRGVPSAVNGVTVPLVELLEIVTTIAGDHGIGRRERHALPDAGDRLIVESPAADVLGLAHAALERAATDDDVRAVKRVCSLAYRDLVSRGRWFSPARDAIDALVARVQARVSGTVRLRLSRGACHLAGVQVARDATPLRHHPSGVSS
jgi:argininosuccinate synthase